MIQRITIENFKSLKQVDLELGRMNLFIGTNASGKSNLFDALRVLRGVAGGFPVKELFEGGARTVTGDMWPGIRGGLVHAPYRTGARGANANGAEVRLAIELSDGPAPTRYELGFNSSGATTRERLARGGREVFLYDGQDAFFRLEGGGLSACYPNASLGSQIILAFRTGLAGEHKAFVEDWLRRQANVQFCELEPDVLRRYGSAADIPRMGEHGENFASLARHICADPQRQEAYLTWLQELRPREVDEVKILSGAVDEPLFAVREGGKVFPAPVLSDGTLRFAALAAAFFQPDMPEVLAVEEIENGIHAGRLRLLVQLLRGRAGQANTQVLATTHSPRLLDWLMEEEWRTTFFCHRDPATGGTTIVPLTQLPGFRKAARPGRVGELLAEGWMEFAL